MSKASLELGGGNWGTKDGNLLAYAQGNESSKFIPREFTFTRGSDIAATRINSSGLIEKYRENLLLHSNQFDTTWTTSNASVTSGQSGYDGSSDAWLLESTATTTSMRLQQGLSSSSILSYSVYAKKGTADWLSLRSNSSTTAVWFDLSNGVIGRENTGVIDSSIESIGDGWYRLSVIFSSCTSVRLYVTDGDNVFTTTLGDNIYIQDAQLEQGLVATSYLESGATTATSGVADNEPRINYAGGTASLLLEPSRTNLIGYSEYKASSDFTNSTPSYNATSSPEGVQNATEMFDNSTNGQHRVPIGSFAVTSGTDYTISAFVKNNDIGYCYLLLEGSFTQTRYYFNLSTGQPITSGLEVEDFGNSWYRIYVTQSASATGTGSVYLNMSNDGVSPIYTGSSQSLYFYGAQVEEGSYPTSYIPTYGTSVTRVADDVNYFDVSSILTGSNFTLFLDLNDYIGSDINSPNIWLQSTSSGIYIEFRVRPDGYRFYYNGIAGGSAYPISGSTTANKFCVSYDGSNYRLYLDGVLQATTASVGDGGWDRISNQMADASLPLKQMQLFPTTLTDAECITLTT